MTKKLSDDRFVARRAMLMWAIESGEIDPAGKSDAELESIFEEYVQKARRDLTRRTSELQIVITHSEYLLVRAREARRDHEYDYAALFFATWVEHWVNFLCRWLAQKRGLDERCIIDMIQQTQLRGKLTWLIDVLGGRGIASHHRNAILQLSDFRNAFVHYKWRGENCDEPTADAKLELAVNGFESTIRYLQSYQRSVIRKSVTRNIYRFARK